MAVLAETPRLPSSALWYNKPSVTVPSVSPGARAAAGGQAQRHLWVESTTCCGPPLFHPAELGVSLLLDDAWCLAVPS